MKFTSSAAKYACALVLNMFMSVFCAPLFSQTANGRILGTVKDQTGGAIVGATITVVDTARGIERAITTDQDGAYLAPNLIPGTYTVRAEYKGFRMYERQNVVVEVGKDVAVDVVMSPASRLKKSR